MDPLHICIALGPVCVYLLLLGWINLSPRPFVTTGARDLMALAVAIVGFVVAGPLELFMPESAAVYFRGWVWIPLVMLYVLSALLTIMLLRPRLVIYNISAHQLRPILDAVARQLDEKARWQERCLALPGRGIHLSVEAFAAMRNVQLVSVGVQQDLNGWRQLQVALTSALRDVNVGVNPRGFSLVFFGFLIVCTIGYAIVSGQTSVAKSLQDFLRM